MTIYVDDKDDYDMFKHLDVFCFVFVFTFWRSIACKLEHVAGAMASTERQGCIALHGMDFGNIRGP